MPALPNNSKLLLVYKTGGQETIDVADVSFDSVGNVKYTVYQAPTVGISEFSRNYTRYDTLISGELLHRATWIRENFYQ